MIKQLIKSSCVFRGSVTEGKLVLLKYYRQHCIIHRKLGV